MHTAVLDKIASDIADLKRNNSETVAKIAEYKQKVMDLEHRVLKVLISIFNFTNTDNALLSVTITGSSQLLFGVVESI